MQTRHDFVAAGESDDGSLHGRACCNAREAVKRDRDVAGYGMCQGRAGREPGRRMPTSNAVGYVI